MSKIKILIVESEKRPYVKYIENTLEEKQCIVGGLLYFYEAEKDVDFIWNEEGKELDLEFNRVITNDVIAGTFIIAGQKNGESISLTRKQIRKYKKLFAVKRDIGTIVLLKKYVGHSNKSHELNFKEIEKWRDVLILDRKAKREYKKEKKNAYKQKTNKKKKQYNE